MSKSNNLSLENLFMKPVSSSNGCNIEPIENTVEIAPELKGKKNTFLINDDVQVRFNNYVKRSGTKRAAVVNQALIVYLDRHEKSL